MQILFRLSRVFSAFLPEYNMCIASRMVMFREPSSPGHWLPLTACRILSTILSFPLPFNLAHCQGNNKEVFCGRKINFRDVDCDTAISTDIVPTLTPAWAPFSFCNGSYPSSFFIWQKWEAISCEFSLSYILSVQIQIQFLGFPRLFFL